jgi:Tfp pilus assembly protein PilZ
MTNLSRGGVFIATESPASIGTRLQLLIHVEGTGERLEVPVEVVSVNVGPQLMGDAHGMGLRFLEAGSELQRQLDRFYERRLAEAAEKAD